MGRPRKHDVKKETPNYIRELKGILLILVSIIGIFKFGIVGNIVRFCAAFLVGEWFYVLLILVALSGIYVMMRMDKKGFLNTNLIGFYIFVFSALILSHISYINEFDLVNKNVISETLKNLGGFWNSSTISGGGMIGALFSALFIKLFSIEGTKVICIVLIICGVIMFTGLSVYDIMKALRNKTKDMVKFSKKDKLEISKVEDDYEKDDKIIVSSMEELIHHQADKKEELKPVKAEKEVVIPDEPTNDVYFYPPITLLAHQPKGQSKENEEVIKSNVPVIETVLRDFAIESKVVSVHVGPAVTQYELEIKAGTKVARILGLNREIALALAARDVRIQAPIPGKNTIGIELPNKNITTVTVREVLERVPKNLEESKLLVTLGRDIMGNPQFCEINKTPHLLVAGATGSGKSVCINSMIVSILMRAKPDEVKLVLIDPKKVELSMYNGVPHLLTPVVTDPRKASIALKKIVVEMEKRYDMFETSGTKNIAGYNFYIDKKNKSLPEDEQIRKIPYIVVIIDELADLMLIAAKEVEDSIMRITQMARAAGIHLIVATQRPSTDVITGIIKANIPSRISFAVSSSIDSRTILDAMGAEKLLGKGDMLFLPQGENTPIRIQGTFIADEEIKNIVDYTIKQQKARYDETFLMDEEEMHGTTMVEGQDYDGSDDPIYNEVVEFVVKNGKASTSLIQRRFRLGYNRAARLVDLLEDRGIVGPQNGSKPREVLVELEHEEY